MHHLSVLSLQLKQQTDSFAIIQEASRLRQEVQVHLRLNFRYTQIRHLICDNSQNTVIWRKNSYRYRRIRLSVCDDWFLSSSVSGDAYYNTRESREPLTLWQKAVRLYLVFRNLVMWLILDNETRTRFMPFMCTCVWSNMYIITNFY